MNRRNLRDRMARLPVRARWLAGGMGSLLLLALLLPRESVSSAPSNSPALELLPEDIAVVKTAPLTADVRFSGTLEPVRQMMLNARVAGEIMKIPVREGEPVEAGAVLVQQDSRDMRARLAQAEAAVASSRAEADNAREQVAKYSQLTLKNFFSRSDLDKVSTQAAVYDSQLRANEAQLVVARKELENALLRAPFSGVVAERLVEPGQLVVPNTPLLRVVDLRELELAIPLAPADLAHVKKGQRVMFTSESSPGQEFAGVIVRMNPMAKASNRKITVYARVHNPDLTLRGGLFVRGRLQDADAASGLVVPETAVLSHEGEPGVMVVRRQRLLWQPVTLGVHDDRSGNVLVLRGLAEGDTVVATGVAPERAGAMVHLAGADGDIRRGD